MFYKIFVLKKFGIFTGGLSLFLIKFRAFRPLDLQLGIYNSRVTKPNYETELRIITSQTELLTLKFYLFNFFELVTRYGKTLI